VTIKTYYSDSQLLTPRSPTSSPVSTDSILEKVLLAAVVVFALAMLSHFVRR
jgi:hypothetical protein